MYFRHGKRIERRVGLIYRDKVVTVTVTRPKGNRWSMRTYKPTPSSIKRIKRIIGYPYGVVTTTHNWQKIIETEYMAFV